MMSFHYHATLKSLDTSTMTRHTKFLWRRIFQKPMLATDYCKRWDGVKVKDLDPLVKVRFLYKHDPYTYLTDIGLQGRVDPVRIDVKEDVIGIGKAQEEQAYHESSTAKRKALGSEKQLEETEEERQQRESKAEKQQLIAEELKQVKRAFYCELCDKQYSKIAEYEQHLQSYDHHHKKVCSRIFNGFIV